MTDPPKDLAYSSVASLRSIRIVSFLGELNDLELMVGDIGNAYLEAVTTEKVCFTAGPEFGPLQGHTFVIYKALYGLVGSSGAFRRHLCGTLRKLGFVSSFADPDVWFRDAGDKYEYVATWVDDLLAAMKNPTEFFEVEYKLKGVGPPQYHLGGDFYRDPDGTLCLSARTYIQRLLENYRLLYGESPKTYVTPLVKGDHPELDNSEPCTGEETFQYQLEPCNGPFLFVGWILQMQS